METPPTSVTRIPSLDALRGAVMILMALDHVRDFFHVDAAAFSPTDLTKTTAVLFLTRWITHFCLPVFLFTAGAGAYLRGQRRERKAELSRFLWTRGLWFILLEVTAMRLAYNFDFSLRHPLFLLVLWIFGICMISMAALVAIPVPALGLLSVAALLGSGLLDSVQAAQFGHWSWLWNLIHQPGAFSWKGLLVVVSYPLLPWILVMASGYSAGALLRHPPAQRQRVLIWIGAGLIVAFVVLRMWNHYGDPAPWSQFPSALFTVLSFLNCTKYPGSLDFILMTLGPALVVLAWMDGRQWTRSNPLIVFGRVPLFYFVLHFYAIHLLFVLLAFARYGGRALMFAFSPPPAMGAAPGQFPAGFGYSLGAVYAIWIFVVVTLYPLCRWFGKVRAKHGAWWFSYL